MSTWQDSTYGDAIADVYDEWFGDVAAPSWLDSPGSVAFIAELSKGRKVLELGCGTGRLALPLAAQGVKIYGVDASERMLSKLKERTVGRYPMTARGNFASRHFDEQFGVIVCAFTTFFMLRDGPEQLGCLRNACEQLEREGRLVIETFVPYAHPFEGSGKVAVQEVQPDFVKLSAIQDDPVGQVATAQTIVISNTGIRLFPLRLRYLWPMELDLMAELAGLELESRWAGWRNQEFVPSSPRYVAVYRKRSDG